MRQIQSILAKALKHNLMLELLPQKLRQNFQSKSNHADCLLKETGELSEDFNRTQSLHNILKMSETQSKIHPHTKNQENS